jgi:hypothetical protein
MNPQIFTRLRRCVTSGLAGYAVTWIVAWASYHLGFWLGPAHWGDFSLEIWLTSIYALLIGVTAFLWSGTRSIGLRRGVAGACVGVALGIVYTFLVFRFLVPGFSAVIVRWFSFWTAGAVSGLLVISVQGQLRRAMAVTSVCLLATLLPKPIFNMLNNSQQLTVALVLRTSEYGHALPLPPSRWASPGEMEALSKEIGNHVRSLSGENGELQMIDAWRVGEGKPAFAIIVVQPPVTRRMLLPEPAGSVVVYIQKNENWIKYPAGAKTLGRSITISPDGDGMETLGMIDIPDSDGLSRGGRIHAAPQSSAGGGNNK